MLIANRTPHGVLLILLVLLIVALLLMHLPIALETTGVIVELRRAKRTRRPWLKRTTKQKL